MHCQWHWVLSSCTFQPLATCVLHCTCGGGIDFAWQFRCLTTLFTSVQLWPLNACSSFNSPAAFCLVLLHFPLFWFLLCSMVSRGWMTLWVLLFQYFHVYLVAPVLHPFFVSCFLINWLVDLWSASLLILWTLWEKQEVLITIFCLDMEVEIHAQDVSEEGVCACSYTSKAKLEGVTRAWTKNTRVGQDLNTVWLSNQCVYQNFLLSESCILFWCFSTWALTSPTSGWTLGSLCPVLHM